MIKYKKVENPRKRVEDYKDGDAITVGYQFFDSSAYTRASSWLEQQGIDFVDDGFDRNKEFDIFVTTHHEKDALLVFNNIASSPTRLCVTSSAMVDLL